MTTEAANSTIVHITPDEKELKKGTQPYDLRLKLEVTQWSDLALIVSVAMVAPPYPIIRSAPYSLFARFDVTPNGIVSYHDRSFEAKRKGADSYKKIPQAAREYVIDTMMTAVQDFLTQNTEAVAAAKLEKDQSTLRDTWRRYAERQVELEVTRQGLLPLLGVRDTVMPNVCLFLDEQRGHCGRKAVTNYIDNYDARRLPVCSYHETQITASNPNARFIPIAEVQHD